MDCLNRKGIERIVPNIRGPQDLLWRNFVRQIHKVQVRMDAERHPFHLADIGIPSTKITEKCDTGSRVRLGCSHGENDFETFSKDLAASGRLRIDHDFGQSYTDNWYFRRQFTDAIGKKRTLRQGGVPCPA